MLFEYKEIVKPRISDINYGGHLGHKELLGLLHEVRAQFLSKNNISEIEINGACLLMKELIVAYANQAFWNDELKICMAIEPKKARIVFRYTVYNVTTNNITAKAEAAMVLVNKTNQKPLKPHLFFELLKNESILL